MDKSRPISIPPYHRLASHPLWARDAAAAVQHRNDPGIKERDLFKLRHSAITEPRLTSTIIDILRYLKYDEDISLLAKSIRIEFGDTVENTSIPQNIQGRKLYYAARLLILAGESDKAQELLERQPLVKGRIIGILMRDQNPVVTRTAFSF